MKTNKLTGKVLFGNVVTPKSYDSGAGKFVEDARGVFQLTLVVDENHKDYPVFAKAINDKIAEIKSEEKYKKLVASGVDVSFSYKDKEHHDKDNNIIAGKRQITMKRNAINKKSEKASIEVLDKFGQPYTLQGDIGYGTDVQVAFSVYDTYIASSKTWYITFCLLAVMVMKEQSQSYGFDIEEPSVDNYLEEVAKNFDAEQEPELPF